MKTLAWCCSVAGLLLLCGCGGSDPSISGTVNLDGKPVPQGDIRFIPIEDTAGADGGAVIQEGKYKAVLTGLAGGKYRVSIRGYNQGGRMERDPLGGPPVKGNVQIVPKEYRGEDSKLVRELVRGVNRIDFELRTSGTGE